MTSQHIFDLAVWQFAQLSAAIAVVGVVTRMFCRRRPVLAYSLWLLVLLKSLTPPIWNCPTGIFTWAGARPVVLAVTNPDHTLINVATPSQVIQSPVHLAAARIATPVSHAWQPLLALWMCGFLGVLVVIVIRSWLLARKIARFSIPLPQGLVEILESTCRSLGLRRVPTVRLCRAAIGPAVFGIFRPTLVLPATIAGNDNLPRLRVIVMHEMIHLRRRDPLVAGVQLLSQMVWWFHPLVWWMNRQISESREICCDGDVIDNLQCPPADYAQVLIDVLRLRRPFEPMPLSMGIGSAPMPVRRFNYIMNHSKGSQRMSWQNWTLVAAGALLLLPGATLLPPAAAADQDDQKPVESNQAIYDFLGQPVAPPADLNPAYSKDGLTKAVQIAAQSEGVVLNKVEVDDSEFPYLVGFLCDHGGEKVKDHFKKTPSTEYAFVGSEDNDSCVAMDIIPNRVIPPEDEDRVRRRKFVRVQMFYDKLGQESRGDATLPSQGVILPALPPAQVSELIHVVPFQIGVRDFSNPGDSVTITEVRSNRQTFQVDGTYQVSGVYHLASQDHATLALYLTAKRLEDGRGYTWPTQTIQVNKGDGRFTLTEHFACEGYPHVSFYSGGSGIGGVYFGTGDFLLKP